MNKASIKYKVCSISTLNPPEDVELAEVLLKDHKWAGGVRYVILMENCDAIFIRRAFPKKEKFLILWLSWLA